MPVIEVASKGGIIRSEYSVLYGSVAIIFLVSGMQLSPEKLRKNVFNWRLHILTQGISFILIPLIWLGMPSKNTVTARPSFLPCPPSAVADQTVT